MEKILTESFMTILNEGLVFRKSKELLECETLLDEMLIEIRKPVINTKITTEKIEAVRKILEEYYNFEFLALHIGGTNVLDVLKLISIKNSGSGGLGSGLGIANAFTTKKDFISSIKHMAASPTEYIRRDRGRLEWSGELRPVSTITVNNGLLLIKDITGAEVLSVILHEIGHNYYHGTVQSRILTSIMSLFSSILGLLAIIHSSFVSTFISAANSNFLTASIFNFTYSMIQTIVGEGYSLLYTGRLTERSSQYLGFLGKAINSVGTVYNSLKTISVISRLLQIVTSSKVAIARIIGQGAQSFLAMDMLGEEKFSDEFAAIHGYGPEITSALSKMSGTDPWVRDNEEAGFFQLLCYINAYMASIASTFDPHPDIASRPIFLLDFYKKQLQITKDPRERKFIEEQIVKVIKASPLYKVTSKESKPIELEKMKISPTDRLLMVNSITDYLKELATSDEGSANTLDDKLTMKGK